MSIRTLALAGLLAALSLSLLWSRPLPGPTGRYGTKEILLITQAQILREIEELAGSLGERLEGKSSRAFNNELLSKRLRYSDLVSTIERDLNQLRMEDHSLGVGTSNVHRLFDVGWLRSPQARFELIGVVNRLDRRPFDQTSCGEIRLIYRLAYETSEGISAASRLPMTLSLTYSALDEHGGADCTRVARRWSAPPHLAGRNLGAWMVSKDGPLAPPMISWERLKSVDINLQSVRWPSAVRPDMGGHAEYLLRSLRPDPTGKHLVDGPLENTPDIRRLRRDPALRSALLAWIRDPSNLSRIDAGIAALPTKYLALRAISVAPHGMLRRNNRPFRQIFETKDFSDLKLENLRFVRSPEALLRRLDDMSCMGCHQARSAAGFHLLGEEAQSALIGNSLAVPFSPHLLRDLERRRIYLRDLAAGRKPREDRPFSERASSNDNGYGAHCGLGDVGFASWTCAPGLSCHRYLARKQELLVGQCLPLAQVQLGDPCEVGTLTPIFHPHEDHIDGLVKRNCGESHVCDSNAAGFPGGMCSTSCALLGKDKNGICGAIADLADFNQCLTRKAPLAECLADHVRPAGLRVCDQSAPCRDDYVCAKTPNSNLGACVPPSFLLELRVDGHPRSLVR